MEKKVYFVEKDSVPLGGNSTSSACFAILRFALEAIAKCSDDFVFTIKPYLLIDHE